MKLLSYILTCFLLSLMPGPDNCFVLTQSIANGFSAGFWTTLGLCTGLCVHISLALLGLATLLQRRPIVLQLISLFGALYLLWIAWQTYHQPVQLDQLTELATTHEPMLKFYLRGVIMNLSNPKIILFFVAFFPKFISSQWTHPLLPIMGLSTLFICATAIVFNAIAYAGTGVKQCLIQLPQLSGLIATLSSGILVLLALWISIPVFWQWCKGTKK